MTEQFNLAEANMSILRADAEPDRVNEFQAAVNPLIAIAKACSGFRGVIEPQANEIAPICTINGQECLLNVSVWDSLDSLYEFFSGQEHVSAMRHFRDLFVKIDGPTTALWWVPLGNVPDLSEAENRLTTLRDTGPSEYVFDLRNVSNFPPHSTLL